MYNERDSLTSWHKTNLDGLISGWLVVWVLWHINLYWLINAKSIFMKIVLFKTIQFSISTQFKCEKHFYFKLFSLFTQF